MQKKNVKKIYFCNENLKKNDPYGIIQYEYIKFNKNLRFIALHFEILSKIGLFEIRFANSRKS